MFSVNVYVQIIASIAGTFVSSLILFLAWSYLTSPIKRIPGPFLAKCTNWWRFYSVYNNQQVHDQRFLHKKYGSAVQLGPNLVSLSDPSLLQTLYDTRGHYLKSKFYDNNSSKVGNEIAYNVFSTRSNKEHAHFLRPIRKLFTLSSLLRTEPLVDATIQTLLSRLDSNFVDSSRACDMTEWLPFFSWDVIGNLTLGAPPGYLEHGCDFNGSQRTGDQTFFYFGCVGQIPELDYWLVKNPFWRIGPPAFDGAAMMCMQRIAERKREYEIEGESTHNDILEGFMRANRETPDQMSDSDVMQALMVTLLAGGDTTGTLLCSIIYYVLKDQRVYNKLMEELDGANLELPVSFASAEKLPFFDAIVREAGRMHPGVGGILERVVPDGGLTLADGRFLAPGIVVGMNAWVIHESREIFGEDAELFNPDRWLRGEAETKEEHQVRFSLMKSHDLSFGAGARVCMGRSVSILETYKVMSTLFLTYEMSLVDPSQDWNVVYSWFTKQSGIKVKIERRDKSQT